MQNRERPAILTPELGMRVWETILDLTPPITLRDLIFWHSYPEVTPWTKLMQDIKPVEKGKIRGILRVIARESEETPFTGIYILTDPEKFCVDNIRGLGEWERYFFRMAIQGVDLEK